MKASELTPDSVINYRGYRAQVLIEDFWALQSDAPRSFQPREEIAPQVDADGRVIVAGRAGREGFPIGCTIEWVEVDENGQERTQQCRLLFDSPDADTADGLNGPLMLWGG